MSHEYYLRSLFMRGVFLNLQISKNYRDLMLHWNSHCSCRFAVWFHIWNLHVIFALIKIGLRAKWKGRWAAGSLKISFYHRLLPQWDMTWLLTWGHLLTVDFGVHVWLKLVIFKNKPNICLFILAKKQGTLVGLVYFEWSKLELEQEHWHCWNINAKLNLQVLLSTRRNY